MFYFLGTVGRWGGLLFKLGGRVFYYCFFDLYILFEKGGRKELFLSVLRGK